MDGGLKLLCSGCGANLEYSAGARALKCVYCSAVTEIPRADDEETDLEPDHIVTLAVTRNQLEDAVFQHLAEGKYTPDNLLEHATFTKVEQFFVPAYTFAGTYEATWTASFGYDRTEHYTDYVRDSNGRSRPVSRTKTVTDWRPVNGTDSGDFKVLTYAGARLNASALDLTARLVEGCRMRSDVVDYSASFTSGFEVEAYAIKSGEAYTKRGDVLVNQVIEAGVMRHAQGDRQKDWHWKASTRKKSARVLIPVCHVVYEYQGQAYNVWIDGTSTANQVADAAPEDDSRRRAVRKGFIPAAVAILGFIFAASRARAGLGALPEGSLMWIGLGGALIYGALRRHAILSYSLKLRQAILAQRKLDNTNTSNIDEAERLKMVQACKRPDRVWIANTLRDTVALPIASVIALVAVVTPLLHEEINIHRMGENADSQALAAQIESAATSTPSPQAQTENPVPAPTTAATQSVPASQTAQVAPDVAQTTTADAAPASDTAPQTEPQTQQGNSTSDAVPAQSTTATPSAAPVTLAQPVLAVLSAAAQTDWSGVDRNADLLDQGEAQHQEHGNRAVARAANEEGKAALQAENYPASVDAFRRGVAADPADIELLNNLAYALEEAGQQQDAVNAISNVLARAPRRTAAWANLSSSLAKSGQIDEAIAALSIAVHYSTNRDRTLAFLQQQAASGHTDAERHVNAAVLQQAQNIPTAAAPTVAEAQPVAQRPHPAMRPAANRQSSSGDEAYVRSMNQQLEQQLKELGQSK